MKHATTITRRMVTKRTPLAVLALALMLTAAVPTLAQEGNTKDGPLPAQGEAPKGDSVVHIDCAPGYELVKGDDRAGKEDKCVPKTSEDNSNNGGAAGVAKNLPATGGALPITGLLGALLVGGSLLVRRIAR